MPKKKPLRLPLYDLKQKFTTLSGSTYYSAGNPSDNLILWARAATKDAVPTTAIDDSGNGHTVTFNGASTAGDTNQVAKSSPFEHINLANLRTPVRFPKSAAPFVKVNDADDLSFGNGAEDGDADFTMASWMLFTSGSATAYIMSKSTEYEFLYHDGALTGSVIDTSATAQLSFRTSLGSSVNVNKWHHLAFTYDASVHSSSRGKLYLDGRYMSGSCTYAGTYVGMEPSANILSIANNQNNQPVEFFDAAIWNKVLSAGDLNALYNIKGGLKDPIKRREYITSTGITSLPVRPYLNMIDNETGSYPSTYRLGDKRTGAYSSSFNDTKVIDFQQIGKGTGPLSGDIVLGVQLPQGSQYSGSLVTAVNSLPDLKLEQGSGANTNVVPGISDARVRFTPGENYTPYTEHRQFAVDKKAKITGLKTSYPNHRGPDPFYATGSAVEEVGFGFDQPLWAKTKIEIDITPTIPTVITFSTGSTYTESANLYGTRGGINSGLSYYNFDHKRWEIHGDFYSGSNVDYFSMVPIHITGSMLAFSPSYPASDADLLKIKDGHPTDIAGFPYAKKFNPTGSQQIDVSSLTKYPFLVEKMEYEFSGSMPFLGQAGASRSNIMTFFIMNEPGYNLPGDVPGSIERVMTGAFPGARSGFTVNGYGTFSKIFTQSQVVDRVRDLVTYSMVSLFASEGTPARIRERDLNIPITSIANIPTGTFVLSASVRAPLPSTGMGILQPRAEAYLIHTARIQNNFGGRNGMALADNGVMISPRSFTDVVASRIPSGSFTFTPDGRNLKIPLDEKQSEVSPYMIFPGDKLTFGWANQQSPGTGIGLMQNPIEAEIAGHGPQAGTAEDGRFTVSPGAGKLVLYGSMIRGGTEFHMGLNQHLTSLAIHEDVQSTDMYGNGYCLDQFDNDYRFALSGSYVDDVTVELDDPRRPPIAGARIDKVAKSVLAGFAGTTGSLFRGVRLPDPNERYYDSLFPDASLIAAANGKSFVQSVASEIVEAAGTVNALLYPLGDVAGSGVDSARRDQVWPRSYPFDIRYGGNDLERVPGVNAQRSTNPLNSGAQQKLVETANLAVIFGKRFSSVGSGGEDTERMYVNLDYVSSTSAIALPDRKQNKTFLKAFYGFGDSGDSNLPIITNLEDTNTTQTKAGSEVQIRGFKYGLISALPTYTSCIFRRDHYGQFRDMLEQRPFTAIQKFQYPAQEGGELVVGGQKSACVSVAFKKAVAISNTDVQLQGFTSDDLTQIENNAVGPRGIWNSTANIDTYSRTNRPFYDVVPLNTSGSVDPGNKDASLLFELGGFTGA